MLSAETWVVLGFEAVFDESTQSWYYWNPETNETSWTDPNADQASQEPQETQEKQDVEEKQEVEDQGQETDVNETQKEEQKTVDGDRNKQLTQEEIDYYNSQEYYNWYMQNYAGADPEQDKQKLKNEAFVHMANLQDVYVAPTGNQYDYSKAMRQMSFYFDVDKYQRERALEILSGKDKQKKLTKKQVEHYKKKNKEKKIKSLLRRMGPD
ncbi:hypothetical protein EDD86DRAFT_245438 [Gorgonomyces haynaldii]|nr:hypothetical protein EDD86DRAFT_245438 [Gorgonomyces haynaldii]